MYEVFEKLLKENGLKTADVAKATGIKPPFFSDWKSGRCVMKTDKRRKIADFFGVSLEYLDTGDESLRNVEKEAEQDTDPNLKALYLIAKSATPEERAAFVRMIKAFKGEQ